VSRLLDVPFRRRTRHCQTAAHTKATSAADTVTENVHMRESAENVNGVKG